jgi:hypothetical protein
MLEACKYSFVRRRQFCRKPFIRDYIILAVGRVTNAENILNSKLILCDRVGASPKSLFNDGESKQ